MLHWWMPPGSRTMLFKVGPSDPWHVFRPGLGAWVLMSTEASIGYSAPFEAATQVTINHNLGRYPASVRVRNAGGQIVDVESRDLNTNQTLLVFDTPIPGYVEIP